MKIFAGLAAVIALAIPAAAQADMPGMAMPDMTMPSTGSLGAYPMSRDASGTSWQPDAATHRGIHLMVGDWMLMAHLKVNLVYDMQTGPRGSNMGFVAGMAMLAARRDLANNDALTLRAMFSPDPFMGRRGYPLLLQTGETADGVTPLVDRQHPHDLVMELSGTYSHRMADGNALFLYVGYPGEPALGPPAFMHRASAEDNPAAPLSHHWLDSTHITFGVATLGLVHDAWKVEVSQFTGREPDQRRFDFESPRFDSTSLRLSFNPDPHWSLQASWGFLRSPEQLAPVVSEQRYTASAGYVMPLGEDSSLAATLAFGRKHLTGASNEDAALAEVAYKPASLWTVFARAEVLQTAELAPGPLHNVGEITGGLIHDWQVAEHLKLGLGGSYTFDLLPGSLAPAYGSEPRGAMLFTRLIAE